MSRTSLLEPVGYLVCGGFGAHFVLVATRRAADADRTDDLISGFEHHAAGDQEHAGKMLEWTEGLSAADSRDDRAVGVVTEGRA